MIDPASLLAFCGTLALNGLLSCAAKVYRAAQYRSAAVLVPAVLGLLWCCNASIPLMAQESQQRPVKNPEREAWRKAMVRTPLPKKGCFQVSYPNKESGGRSHAPTPRWVEEVQRTGLGCRRAR